METPPPTPDTDTRVYPAPTRGFAVASVGLGFFSMIVFFWKPFGLILASVGLVLGLTSWVFGNRGGLRGERTRQGCLSRGASRGCALRSRTNWPGTRGSGRAVGQ